MTYHFIGIKGSGMSALAQILSDMNYKVQGSDINETFFTQKPLEEKNIPILPFRKENIEEGQTIIASAAYNESHEEMKEAKEKNLPIYQYPEFLGGLLQNYTSIAVTGSHGKTSTTGLLAHVLEKERPTSYLIGDGTGKGEMDSEYFVFEACEYRRHFLNYSPDYAIMTNIDFDHPDYFTGIDDVYDAFQEMALKVKKGIIACGEDEYLQKIDAKVPIVYYGLKDEHDFCAKNIQTNEEGTHFDVFVKKSFYSSFTIPSYGTHHVLNALAIIALCHYEEIDGHQVKSHLKSFTGVKRRFSEKKFGSQVLIDDYAHHPREISVTIASVNEKYPSKEVVAIFQPHTYSRTKQFLNEFAESLKEADQVYLCDIFSSAREVQGDLTIEDLHKRIPNAKYIDEKTVNQLEKHGDAVLLFMGAGDVQKYQVAYEKNSQYCT